jgi:hypothetical protein
LSALDIIIAIIALPCLFYIPGFVAFRAFNVHRIESLKLSLFESTFLQILASIVIAGWIAFILAETGFFSLWLLIVILEVGSFIVFAIFKSRFSLPKFSRPRFRLQSAFLLLLIVLAGSLFFHPSEEIQLTHDIGTYINVGANIAKTGSITIHDPIMSSMPDSAKDTFYSMYEGSFSEGQLFPDLPIIDHQLGTVVPWKPPLREVWFAVFYTVFGLRGALYSQPLFGLLGIIAIFIVCKKIWNFRVGIIATSILAVNFVQVFFSQYTCPEILFQFLAFGGMATLILFLRTNNGFFGIISAMCFGQLLMTRIDALLILIPIFVVVLYLILTRRNNKKVYFYFTLPLLVVYFHSIVHIYYFCLSYIAATYKNIQVMHGLNLTPTLVVFSVIGFSVAMAAGLTFAAFHSGINVRIGRILRNIINARWTPGLLIFIVVLFFAYLWLTSPYLGVAENLTLISRNFDPILALSWFVGWPCLALAFLGLISILHNKPRADSYLFLTVITLMLGGYLYTLANNPVFPWGMRRLIPVVIPVIAIFVGCGLEEIIKLLMKQAVFIKTVIIVLLVLILIVPSITMCRTLVRPQYGGFVAQVEETSNIFSANSIILEANAGLFSRFSVPLKFIYGKNAIYLTENPTDAAEFTKMVDLWGQEGRVVYLVIGPGANFDSISSNLSDGVEFKFELTFSFTASLVAWEREHFSNTRVDILNRFQVYKLTTN